MTIDTTSADSSPASPGAAPEHRAEPRPAARGRSRSRRRRHEVRDHEWLAEALSESAKGGAHRVRAWLKVLDRTLATVERVAWEMRDLADTASESWQHTRPATPDRDRSRETSGRGGAGQDGERAAAEAGAQGSAERSAEPGAASRGAGGASAGAEVRGTENRGAHHPRRRRSRAERHAARAARRRERHAERARAAAAEEHTDADAEDLHPGEETERARPTSKYARMASTAWMLFQVGSTYRFHGLRTAFLSPSDARRALERLHGKNAKRFYDTSVRQGGAFLKVGQLISARPDLLPKAWFEELSKLQDDVPPFPFEDVRELVELELGRSLEAAFAEFDPVPLAAASIGQVHRARTHEGLDVAVKVQRPGIAGLIDTDLQLLEFFLDAMRSMLPPTDYGTIKSEIRRVLEDETNYLREGQMMDRIAEFFSGHARIVVPTTVPSHSHGQVLSSRFIEGRKITTVLDELEQAREAGDGEAGPRLDRIMAVLLEAYIRQVLEAGIFQADPHPGNLLVTSDDRLVVLDFGATQPMPREVRDRYLGIVRAFIFSDRTRVVELLAEVGFRTESGEPDTLLLFANTLLEQIREATLAAGSGKVSWPSKREMLERLADLLRQAEADPVLTIPAEFVMIARVFGTLAGLFFRYRPNVDIAAALMPLLGTALRTPGAAAS